MWFEPTSLADTLPVFSGIVNPIGFETPPGLNENQPYHVLEDSSLCCDSVPKACLGAEPQLENAD